MKYLLPITLLIIIGVVLMKKPTLKHFRASEFGIWWPLMDDDLLKKLDAFRERWGYPVEVSKADGSLGRHGGESHSQHNVDRFGKVKAVDFFPKVPDGRGGYRYMQTVAERDRAYRIARQVGFTGIGVYTDTQPGDMMHGDVREPKASGYVATWSRIGGEYFGVDEVLV
jgi:hypothetical protein